MIGPAEFRETSNDFLMYTDQMGYLMCADK